MILDDIVNYKREFVEKTKNRRPLSELKNAIGKAGTTRDFYKALTHPEKSMHIIAEVKKASPSKGVIRQDFEPVSIARNYEEYGADAISVLTDEKYFQGSLDYLTAIRKTIKIPILRKEFIIDEYQVYEARARGADAVLLIAAILREAELSRLYDLSRSLGLSVLVEVHTQQELKKALKISPRIIGINNRNLCDFTVDINQTVRLRRLIPNGICVVSESGIKTSKNLAFLAKHNVYAVLIGETLMRAANPGNALEKLRAFPR